MLLNTHEIDGGNGKAGDWRESEMLDELVDGNGDDTGS